MVYFAPEAAESYRRLGLEGQSGYFASRSAPMGAVSAGTFDSSGTGTVWRVLDGSITVGDLIGVTVEPKGGSTQPTTDPIVAIQSS